MYYQYIYKRYKVSLSIAKILISHICVEFSDFQRQFMEANALVLFRIKTLDLF